VHSVMKHTGEGATTGPPPGSRGDLVRGGSRQKASRRPPLYRPPSETKEIHLSVTTEIPASTAAIGPFTVEIQRTATSIPVI